MMPFLKNGNRGLEMSDHLSANHQVEGAFGEESTELRGVAKLERYVGMLLPGFGEHLLAGVHTRDLVTRHRQNSGQKTCAATEVQSLPMIGLAQVILEVFDVQIYGARRNVMAVPDAVADSSLVVGTCYLGFRIHSDSARHQDTTIHARVRLEPN